MALGSLKRLLLTALILIALALNLLACNRGPSGSSQQSTATATPAPAKITADDLQKLRWIEGTWRGSGYETPFFERYRFENDDTLIVETLADESVSKVTDTSRFVLKAGQFGSEGAVATELTDTFIVFSPLKPGQNTFRFERESADSWKAVLTWPKSEKRAAGERVYHMQRWPAVQR
jgi:hypothetical protein